MDATAAPQHLLKHDVSADPATPAPDPDCCAGRGVAGDGGTGCPTASACDGVVLALAAAWPRVSGTVPAEAAPSLVASRAPPHPLAVVWRPPIRS